MTVRSPCIVMSVVKLEIGNPKTHFYYVPFATVQEGKQLTSGAS